MKLSFFIQPANTDTSNSNLYVEINKQGLSYIILDNGICVALVIYHFEQSASDESAAGYIHQIIEDQPVLLQKFNSIHIIYSYATAVLVPQAFINGMDNNAVLELVYGEDSERIIRTDFLSSHAIQNVYGIPLVVDSVMTRYFGFAGFTHIFSLLPGVMKEAGNYLYCIFSNGQLKALFIKDGKLQVIQNFKYSTPEDIAYQLLNICNRFEVNADDVVVRLSGMIDASSALYNELFKYFLFLEFEKLPDQYQYPPEISQYPDHYFSHLFSIAACV